MPTSSPVEQKDRTVIVDVIRGFALVGVLLANFNAFVDQQIPEKILESISIPFDYFLMQFNSIFLEWKFMTLFSILFGYGFGLILESLERKSMNPNPFFVKRMFWLFIFGVLHCLFWWGDVLNLYAMSGVLLLFFRKRSNRFILICGISFMFFFPIIVSYAFRNLPETFTEADIQGVYDQYKKGNILDLFAFNINFYYRMFILSGTNVHDIIETLGRFLLGYFLLRIKFLQDVESKKHIFKRISLVAAPLMISYFIFRWLLMKHSIQPNPFAASFLLSIGIVSTTTFYVCILVLAYIRYGLNNFFTALQSIGKMTLTNYLLVSTFLVIVLYGFGFNQLGKWPAHIVWLIALCWLIIEVVFSSKWLQKFRFGPAEWIWRQLTYWKRLALRK